MCSTDQARFFCWPKIHHQLTSTTSEQNTLITTLNGDIIGLLTLKSHSPNILDTNIVRSWLGAHGVQKISHFDSLKLSLSIPKTYTYLYNQLLIPLKVVLRQVFSKLTNHNNPPGEKAVQCVCNHVSERVGMCNKSKNHIKFVTVKWWNVCGNWFHQMKCFNLRAFAGLINIPTYISLHTHTHTELYGTRSSNL